MKSLPGYRAKYIHFFVCVSLTWGSVYIILTQIYLLNLKISCLVGTDTVITIFINVDFNASINKY